MINEYAIFLLDISKSVDGRCSNKWPRILFPDTCNVSYEPIILVSYSQVSLNYQLFLCIFLEMSGSKQTCCKMTNTKVGIALNYEYSST